MSEEQQWYYLTHNWEDKWVHTFPKGICPKVNVIARLEFELASCNSAVQRFTPRGLSIMVKVFANGPGDLGSIPGRVIPKTQKVVPDVTLLNTQHYKLRIKGKVEQPRERSCALPYTLVS